MTNKILLSLIFATALPITAAHAESVSAPYWANEDGKEDGKTITCDPTDPCPKWMKCVWNEPGTCKKPGKRMEDYKSMSKIFLAKDKIPSNPDRKKWGFACWSGMDCPQDEASLISACKYTGKGWCVKGGDNPPPRVKINDSRWVEGE